MLCGAASTRGARGPCSRGENRASVSFDARRRRGSPRKRAPPSAEPYSEPPPVPARDPRRTTAAARPRGSARVPRDTRRSGGAEKTARRAEGPSRERGPRKTSGAVASSRRPPEGGVPPASEGVARGLRALGDGAAGRSAAAMRARGRSAAPAPAPVRAVSPLRALAPKRLWLAVRLCAAAARRRAAGRAAAGRRPARGAAARRALGRLSPARRPFARRPTARARGPERREPPKRRWPRRKPRGEAAWRAAQRARPGRLTVPLRLPGRPAGRTAPRLAITAPGYTRRLANLPDPSREVGADPRAVGPGQRADETAWRRFRPRWRPRCPCPICMPVEPPRAVPSRLSPSSRPGEPPATASPTVAERTTAQPSTATSAARRRAMATARPPERDRLRVSTRMSAISSFSELMAKTFSTNSSPVRPGRLGRTRQGWPPVGRGVSLPQPARSAARLRTRSRPAERA